MQKEQHNVTTKNDWVKRFFEWLLYLIGYTLVFLVVSLFFKTFYIDSSYYGLYGFLAVMIISILNKTIKPILVTLTIPITGLTLGLFYPCINLFILKLTDWILGSHFNLENIWIAFLIAILLSVFNIIVEKILIDPILRMVKHE